MTAVIINLFKVSSGPFESGVSTKAKYETIGHPFLCMNELPDRSLCYMSDEFTPEGSPNRVHVGLIFQLLQHIHVAAAEIAETRRIRLSESKAAISAEYGLNLLSIWSRCLSYCAHIVLHFNMLDTRQFNSVDFSYLPEPKPLI